MATATVRRTKTTGRTSCSGIVPRQRMRAPGKRPWPSIRLTRRVTTPRFGRPPVSSRTDRSGSTPSTGTVRSWPPRRSRRRPADCSLPGSSRLLASGQWPTAEHVTIAIPIQLHGSSRAFILESLRRARRRVRDAPATDTRARCGDAALPPQNARRGPVVGLVVRLVEQPTPVDLDQAPIPDELAARTRLVGLGEVRLDRRRFARYLGHRELAEGDRRRRSNRLSRFGSRG